MKFVCIAVCLLMFGCAVEEDHARVESITCDIHNTYDMEPSRDRIKTPAETMRDGAGDCADLSALLAYYLVEEKLTPFEFVVWDGGYDALHANIRYYGIVYDPIFCDWNGAGWVEIKTYRWGNLIATWENTTND